MAFIEIQNLFKRFKKVVAINHIQLEVNKGEMLTLLGPSGCGKTTTLRCIAGLEKPDQGDIVIDGKPMLSQGFVQPSKRGIGMVFQNYAVWPHMKVYNNIVGTIRLHQRNYENFEAILRNLVWTRIAMGQFVQVIECQKFLSWQFVAGKIDCYSHHYFL